MSDAEGFHKHVESLTGSQRVFVDLLLDWYRNGRKHFFFAIVSGGPGCGKTYTVVQTLSYFRTRVLKMAPTGRLASEIGGKTIHSTLGLHDFGEGSEIDRVQKLLRDETDVDRCLTESDCLQNLFKLRDPRPPDVVVFDELSMTPFWFVYQIGRYFSELGLKKLKKNVAMVCMGDGCQLKPVESNLNVFDFEFENVFPSTVRIQMFESKRFTKDYVTVVDCLRELMLSCPDVQESAVVEEDGGRRVVADPSVYDSDSFFQYVSETFPVTDCITLTTLANTRRVLAYRNETVDKYNDHYIWVKLKKQPLFELPTLKTVWVGSTAKGVPDESKPPTYLRKGCLALITENGCGHNAFNGTRVIFLDYDGEHDEAVCESEQHPGLVIRVARSKYSHRIPLAPGFATTVHKYQGGTIDETGIVMCFDGCADKNLVYTGLSRVRKMQQILAVTLKK